MSSIKMITYSFVATMTVALNTAMVFAPQCTDVPTNGITVHDKKYFVIKVIPASAPVFEEMPTTTTSTFSFPMMMIFAAGAAILATAAMAALFAANYNAKSAVAPVEDSQPEPMLAPLYEPIVVETVDEQEAPVFYTDDCADMFGPEQDVPEPMSETDSDSSDSDDDWYVPSVCTRALFGTKEEPKPNFTKGQAVYYCKKGKMETATILEVHLDDQLVPFYRVQLGDGRGIDTVQKYLTPT